MRQNFRIKTDLSKIYQDERKYSWVYVDNTKILYVNHLIEHIRKIFDITRPFHLLSKCDETFYFLPFEEDVRILENNDTVLIVPRFGEINQFQTENQVQVCEIQNGFVEPSRLNSKNSNAASEKASIDTDNLDNSDAVSINDTFYRTALHETVVNNTTEEQQINEDLTDSNSIFENSSISNKRKRTRNKKKQKKETETLAEVDTSSVEAINKKPKIVDSVLISSGKHIRFKEIDNEEPTSDNNVCNGSNSYKVKQNSNITNKPIIHKDLAALLNLRQSSTPLTFSHKRMKRDFIPESINETEMDIDTSEIANNNNHKSATINKSSNEVNTSLNEVNKSTSEVNKSSSEVNKSSNEVNKSKVKSVKENSKINESLSQNDTVSFKVFKIGEDYTPQVSSMILATVLNHDEEGSQYTLKILHGKDQLQEPDGKFSLPKEEDDENDIDIITLDQSKLLELTRVHPV